MIGPTAIGETNTQPPTRIRFAPAIDLGWGIAFAMIRTSEEKKVETLRLYSFPSVGAKAKAERIAVAQFDRASLYNPFIRRHVNDRPLRLDRNARYPGKVFALFPHS
ncbi:hypothetical protein JCM19992_26650 [Thermostilla marina]